MLEQHVANLKIVQQVFNKRTEELPIEIVTLREVPDDVPGGTEWNEAIRKAREEAWRVMSPGGSTREETSDTAWMGRHYPHLMNMFLNDHKELVDARKRLAEYDGGGPDFKGSSKPSTEVKATPTQKYWKTLESIKGSTQDD
jgi:hypothetical protein